MEKTNEEKLCGMLEMVYEFRVRMGDMLGIHGIGGETCTPLAFIEAAAEKVQKDNVRLNSELDKARKRIAELTAQRQEAQSTVNSIATMLGWGNTPPQQTLERDLQALKERLHLVENERGTAESQVREARRVQKEFIGDCATLLDLPELDENTEYGGEAIRKGIMRWREALEFYGKLGNWQENKEGHDESVCERDFGARARAILGRPDREVPEDGSWMVRAT